jgi:hypothetical protein
MVELHDGSKHTISFSTDVPAQCLNPQHQTDGSSRREFLRLSGLAVGTTGSGLAAPGLAAGQPNAQRKPDAVLAQEGNKRFVIDANDVLPGSIREFVDLIRPATAAVRGKPGDKLDNAIKANIAQGAERLTGLDPILLGPVKTGDWKVVAAIYELRCGLINFLD